MADDATFSSGSKNDLAERGLPRREIVGVESVGADLCLEQILAWADAHHAAHGAWPAVGPGTVSGVVAGAPGESWKAINHALALGLRGLPGDSSLAELLAEHRGAPVPDMSPQALAEKIWAWEQEQFPVKGPKRHFGGGRQCLSLTIGQVLAWADAHRAATGAWPRASSGTVRDAPHAGTWNAIDQALARGRHGLPGGSSLARLLGEQRGVRTVRTVRHRPRLTIDEILAWADAHHEDTGHWPAGSSGPVRGAPPGETWGAVYNALKRGQRGLPGNITLAELLAERRGVRPRPPLTLEQIVAWADAHHAAFGTWPNSNSGKVEGADGEYWSTLDHFLNNGGRGLPGAQSIARLLAEHRSVWAGRTMEPLSVEQVLAWADAYHARYGRWPESRSGPVDAAPQVTWCAINSHLVHGTRGLPGETTLARLLIAHRGPTATNRPPRLTVEQIFAWIDAHHAALGTWPNRESGGVAGVPGESWGKIDQALKTGDRGLSGGASLAKLLVEHRGARDVRNLPKLTIDQILTWADAYHATHGRWPVRTSGAIPAAPGESWGSIIGALHAGHRGLTPGSSLPGLLAQHRSATVMARIVSGGGKLRVEQILAWADAHHADHGVWPAVATSSASGAIAGVQGDAWRAINYALALGRRGLPGGSSLAELLAEHRGVPLPEMGPKALADQDWSWEQEQSPVRGRLRRRVVQDCPRLTIDKILSWADAHRAATGDWPPCTAGRVNAAPFDVTWKAIDCALRGGFRGLPGGPSLFQLLREHRGVRPPLTIEQILAWADAHHAAEGTWPKYLSGNVVGAPGEKWITVDTKLRNGGRGLPGGSSLARLLADHRGTRYGTKAETLSVEQVLAWADAYHATHRRWPDYESGQVDPARCETWCAINAALTVGLRGLPGGTSLARLLIEHRGPDARNGPSRISVEQVLAWADAHHAATGRWPHAHTGPVTEAPHVTWAKIDKALYHGCRGLPGGLSVRQLLAEHRGLFNRGRVPKLTIDQIMAWADAYHAAHGYWPKRDSGLIPGTRHETWIRIDLALAKGRRGLPRIMSLRRLIVEQRSGIVATDAGLPVHKIKAWARKHFPGRRPRRPGASASCPALTIDAILTWADAHHAATGNWPTEHTGRVEGAPFEVTWSQVASALSSGRRGLPGRQTLRSLLVEHRNVGARRTRRVLSVEQILTWVDEFRSTQGGWPSTESGVVAGAPGERWSAIDHALQAGRYGLPGGTTLRRLIAEHRDPDACLFSSRLTVEQILAWMDAHRASTGRWPTAESGPVRDAPEGLTWQQIVAAVRNGHRGLPAGLTWARLQSEYREPRPELTIERILAWADAHRAARGAWPTTTSGRIEETSRETWSIVNHHLVQGGRGLPGGQNLAQFLIEHRGARVRGFLPPLRIEQIVAWANAHHATHGAWPRSDGGPVDGAPGERWHVIDRALRQGWRGLPGGTHLSQVLAEHRGLPARVPAPKLTVDQILAWADAHHESTGQWPTRGSGDIAGTDGESWSKVCDALQRGSRGLPRTGRLSELLTSRRQARCRGALPALTIEQILLWADAHHAAQGRWPTNMSGPVFGAPGESWGSIGFVIANGGRGLSGGTSLSRLLAAHRPTRPSALTEAVVQAWAEAHRKATGFLPTRSSGSVIGLPAESWGSVDRALQRGDRGLPGGVTLAQFLSARCDPSPPRPDTPLTVEQIQIWAKQHHALTGQWPTATSGRIEGAPGEEWDRIAKALPQGGRGLRVWMTLAEFINQHLDPSLPTAKRKLTIEDILTWADAHQERTGRWPVLTSGAVPAEPGLTWSAIDTALRKGSRGVGPGLSLSRLRRQYRSSGPVQNTAPLSERDCPVTRKEHQ